MNRLQIAMENTTLANDLKVVIAPDTSAPVVTVGVYYKIGFRLEPQGRSGFAHLFEHMMFQGSANAPKMQHIKLINSSGGVLNGSTHYDVTNYYESVPSNALERVLWLEADRMRALKVDDENLRNQRDVVKEEVRVNVMNQPYGGFPWLDLPPIAFRNWANAHNFYGDFADLDAADLSDVQAFFKTYYVPNNAVLLVLGDVKAEEGVALAKKYFGDIPAGAAPPFADPGEPEQNEERRGDVEEKFGTLPAMAIGYTVPQRRTSRLVRHGSLGPGAARRPRRSHLPGAGSRETDRCRGRRRNRRYLRLQRAHADGDANSSQARVLQRQNAGRIRRRDSRGPRHRDQRRRTRSN